MEFHQLRYFIALARLKNFSRAAERCHVSQPSLSQQIKKLEEELGERLFERDKRTVALTPAGEAFLGHAVGVVEQAEQAREAVRNVRSVVRGRVVLGVLPTIAPYFLPERLRLFAEQHPEVEVIVNEAPTAVLAEAVVEKQVDLAIVSLPVSGKRLQVKEWFEEELLLAFPADHPLAKRSRLTLEDLRDERFILMHESHCLAGQALQFCQVHGMTPKVQFRSAQVETVLKFVGAGHGISIVPAMAKSDIFPNIRYRSLGGMKPTRKIGLLTREGRVLNRAGQVLAGYLGK